MSEEGSLLSDRNDPQSFTGTVSSVSYRQFTEAKDSSLQSDLYIGYDRVENRSERFPEDVIEIAMDSVLSIDESKQMKNHLFSKYNSINRLTMLRPSASLSDIYNTAIERSQTNLQEVPRNVSLSLPLLPTSFENNVPYRKPEKSTWITSVEQVETQMKPQEPVQSYQGEKINRNLSIESCKRGSTDCINERTVSNGAQKYVEKKYPEVNLPVTSARGAKSPNGIITRPTLADDSKLVKLSLPMNPINIMQSNTHFLNKSRNLLNFITEKSTNIMERALLPQHLAMRYNTVPKLGELNGAYNSVDYPVRQIHIDHAVVQENLSGRNDYVPVKNVEKEKIPVDIGQNEKCTPETVSSQKNELTSKGTATSEKYCISNINDTTNQAIEIAQVADHTSNELPCNKSCENSRLAQDDLLIYILDSPRHDSPQYSAKVTLTKDYDDLKAEYLKLTERVDVLESRNKQLEAEKSGEVFRAQIGNLEKTVDKLTFELRMAIATQETLKKDYAVANKERESMVMKYAIGEKQLIDTQRAKDFAERKVREISKEQELLQNKLRQVQGERSRICNILDGKCREIIDLQREVERLKEDVNMKEVKLKWTQSKLKTEMDAQKETQQKLEKALTRINDMKEECDQVRRDTQESIRKFQQSEENKAVTLDQRLKEQQARLILERHVTEDKEMMLLRLQKEVETLKSRQHLLIEENNTLSLNVQEAEEARSKYVSDLTNLQIIADQRQKEIVKLLANVSELEELKAQLQCKDQLLASADAERKILRSTNEELESDMAVCRRREAEMLDFTQKLTEKNVRLQSEFTALETKMRRLESEQGPLLERINALKEKNRQLEESLAEEHKKRIEECEILAKHVAEQTRLAQNLAQKLEDSQGENAVLKRKHQIGIQEMAREVRQYRKRIESLEAASPSSSLDITSRTGSNASLNAAGDATNGALSDNSTNGDHTVTSIDTSKQELIDRILKLQKINVRRAEKLDFLEEHVRALVEELQKKTKIIQNYILHENYGAMGNDERDRHKAELARHGGIMASVYTQRISDDHMTLELSLEINQKLQAVLEDALLKNITLKDNIDTLGEEIARLTMQNQQRQIAS